MNGDENGTSFPGQKFHRILTSSASLEGFYSETTALITAECSFMSPRPEEVNIRTKDIKVPDAATNKGRFLLQLRLFEYSRSYLS